MTVTMKVFKYTDFENLTDNTFYTYDTNNRRYCFKLIHAEKYPPLPPEQDFEGRTRDAFFLQFQGPKNFHFNQGAIKFYHSDFDKPLVISLVALGNNEDDPECLNFQAVFN
jgi:hypothetical protein